MIANKFESTISDLLPNTVKCNIKSPIVLTTKHAKPIVICSLFDKLKLQKRIKFLPD